MRRCHSFLLRENLNGDQMTMLTSGGGGGSSLKEVVSLAAFSTALLLVLIEADTHLKKALMVLLSAVASWTT